MGVQRLGLFTEADLRLGTRPMVEVMPKLDVGLRQATLELGDLGLGLEPEPIVPPRFTPPTMPIPKFPFVLPPFWVGRQAKKGSEKSHAASLIGIGRRSLFFCWSTRSGR